MSCPSRVVGAAKLSLKIPAKDSFWDLRPLNVKITDEKAILIAFNGRAVDGIGRYSVSSNGVDEDIGWHEDVGQNPMMRKEHDPFMLRELRRQGMFTSATM